MSEHIEKARKLLSNLATYPNAYVAKEKTSLATQAQAYATLAMVEELRGLRTELAPPEVTEADLDKLQGELELHRNRCAGCDHLSRAHGRYGCTFVFGQGSGSACPCDLVPEVKL